MNVTLTVEQLESRDCPSPIGPDSPLLGYSVELLANGNQMRTVAGMFGGQLGTMQQELGPGVPAAGTPGAQVVSTFQPAPVSQTTMPQDPPTMTVDPSLAVALVQVELSKKA